MYPRDWLHSFTCNFLLPIACFGLIDVSVAATTTVTVANATTAVYPQPSTLQFPIVRTGDLGFDVLLDYHTANGTAIGGVDYTAITQTVDLPAGVDSGSIPIAVNAISHPKPVTFDLILDRALGIGAPPAFAAQQTFATGFDPFDVAYADLNGDGKPDIVVRNGDSTFSVLVNTTPPGATVPTFAPQQIDSTTEPISAITMVDVNGDGRPDVVVTNYYGGSVSIFLNTTTPGATTTTFAARQTFSIGSVSSGSNFVAAADLNGDGRPDLIATGTNLNAVVVLLNTTPPGSTTLSFAQSKQFAVGSDPARIAVADLNGDGRPDLVVTNYQGNSMSVLLNSTSPGASAANFLAQQVFATGGFPFAIGVADVNGDGRPDLAISNSADNTVSVFINTTLPASQTLRFAAQKTFATLSGPGSLQLLDLNGDGKPDIVVSEQNSNAISVLLNTTPPGSTSPRFTAQHSFSVGNVPLALIAADLNGDGKPDLVAVNFDDETISVLVNTTPVSLAAADFPNEQRFPAEFDSDNVTIADLNTDGKPDVIQANSSVNTLVIYPSTTGAGANVQTFGTPITVANAGGMGTTAAVDLNGDGRADLVGINLANSSVVLLPNETTPGASPSFGAPQSIVVGQEADAVAVGDVNGDGKPDLLVVDHGLANPPQILVLLNTTSPGSTAFSFATQTGFAVGDMPGSIALADFNGDGQLDIVVGNNSSEANVSVLLNTTPPGATTPSFAPQQKFATGEYVWTVATADLNGDGKPDIIVGDNEGTVSILINTTAPGAAVPSFAGAQSFVVGERTLKVIPADIDGDGKIDIVCANYANGGIVILNNTTPPGSSVVTFNQLGHYLSSSSLSGAAVADLNGDGRPDIVVTEPLGRAMSVLFSSQYQVQLSGAAIGTIMNDRIFGNGFE